MIDFYRRMFAYDIWCTERVHVALKPLIDAGRAVGLFAHLIATQEIWHARTEGIDTAGMTRFPERDIDATLAQAHIMAERWSALLDATGETGLDRIIVYRDMHGDHHETPLREILTHVSNHGTYHRGQIASIVRELGGVPPITDYIIYTRS